MAQLELTDQEKETLAEVLRSFLSELRNEVSHTDRLAYRNDLKAQERLDLDSRPRRFGPAADEMVRTQGPEVVTPAARAVGGLKRAIRTAVRNDCPA